MSKRKNYSDETKAAVMTALLAGQSVNAVAKEYNVPKGTVSGWKHQTQGVALASTQKKEELGDLLMELVITKAKLLIAIARATTDYDWIKSQNSADLAVYAGVENDKLVRMLEAFSATDNDPDSES